MTSFSMGMAKCYIDWFWWSAQCCGKQRNQESPVPKMVQPRGQASKASRTKMGMKSLFSDCLCGTVMDGLAMPLPGFLFVSPKVWLEKSSLVLLAGTRVSRQKVTLLSCHYMLAPLHRSGP